MNKYKINYMIERNCKYCNKIFAPRTRQIKAGTGHYCSLKCSTSGWERPALKDRLWAKVNKGDVNECWVFNGSKDAKGYGRIIVDGSTKLAHRMMYIVVNGDISNELIVMHTCDNPPCCNPNHLKIGTRADNNADRENKGRGKYSSGDDHPNIALKEYQMQDIRRKYAEKGCTQAMLAKEYEVCVSTISKALNR